MLRLFRYLYSYRNTLLLLFLQSISLVVVFTYSPIQRKVFGDRLLGAAYYIDSRRSEILEFFRLKESNRDLAEQSARLREENTALKAQIEKMKLVDMADSTFTYIKHSVVGLDSNVNFIPCKVLRNSTHKDYNLITLDKGSNDGIREDMGVISSKGVVGVVVKAAPNFSIVISALNRSFKLGVKKIRQQNVGIFEWRGGDPRFASLKEIPSDVVIQEGDTIVTSHNSQIFPENYIVGTVDKLLGQKSDGFYEIALKLSVDFRKLDYLFVVRDRRKDELNQAEQLLTNEER